MRYNVTVFVATNIYSNNNGAVAYFQATTPSYHLHVHLFYLKIDK